MRPTLVILVSALVFVLSVQAQQVHRNAFEGQTPVWQKGQADIAFSVQVHETTAQTAHAGKQSEHLQFTAGLGTYIYYSYPVGRADLLDDLALSLWIKGNRPGTQLLARLVIPGERDPKNLDQPLTTLLRGDVYQRVGRWERLQLRNPTSLAQQQQQLLRAELQRNINMEGAYIDQILLNVYSGRGLTEVWIDDLEVSPIVAEQFQPSKTSRSTQDTPANLIPGSPVGARTPRHAVVELNQDRLLVNKRPFFVRGIRYSDTPLSALRDAGFNTLWVADSTRTEALQEAVDLGFWLVPDLPVLDDTNPRMEQPTGLEREVSRYPFSDAVLFWHVGNGMTAEQTEPISKASRIIRAADQYAGRPIAADIWDGFRPYSRNLEMVGMHRWPLMTGLELNNYREWLVQRTRLAEPGTYNWTWIQTHLPEWYTNLIYQQSANQAFDEPIGPQPEQIRLLTYVAISAGYRGLGFWSDRFLANSHQGRDRLLQLALLNQELEMLEPMLATTKDLSWVSIRQADAQSHKQNVGEQSGHKQGGSGGGGEIKAAVIRYEGGVLVIPIWLGTGSQFVPAQLSANNLELIVPNAPLDAQAWEVSPGSVHAVRAERVAGGVKVVIPEFGLTTALVFTSDVNAADGGQVGRLQQAARRSCKLAAQWSYDLAVEELAKVERVNSQLEQMRQSQPDGQALLSKARDHLNAAREAWTRETPSDFRICYLESQRAMRPLRILMRAHWDRAVAPLDSPVCSPYAVSFYTLPQHWQFAEEIKGKQPNGNLMKNGDFETPADQVPEAWSLQEVSLDPVQMAARRVTEKPHEGKQCLKLEVKPTDPAIPPAALERTFLAVNSPQFPVQPGSIVRLSGWVRIHEKIQASPDGVLLFDSIGGEPLALRLTQATPWRKFTWYRRVPESGTVSLTMALTGIGSVCFDDVRIEPLVPGQPNSAANTPPAPAKNPEARSGQLTNRPKQKGQGENPTPPKRKPNN